MAATGRATCWSSPFSRVPPERCRLRSWITSDSVLIVLSLFVGWLVFSKLVTWYRYV